MGLQRSRQTSPTLPMTTADNQHHQRPRNDTALVHGDQPCMQADQDYRQLEQRYRHSAQYAAMVQTYPVLKHAIQDCQQTELVSDHRNPLESTPIHCPQLNWQRSHGEC
jgi:hypothetical protein